MFGWLHIYIGSILGEWNRRFVALPMLFASLFSKAVNITLCKSRWKFYYTLGCRMNHRRRRRPFRQATCGVQIKHRTSFKKNQILPWKDDTRKFSQQQISRRQFRNSCRNNSVKWHVKEPKIWTRCLFMFVGRLLWNVQWKRRRWKFRGSTEEGFAAMKSPPAILPSAKIPWVSTGIQSLTKKEKPISPFLRRWQFFRRHRIRKYYEKMSKLYYSWNDVKLMRYNKLYISTCQTNLTFGFVLLVAFGKTGPTRRHAPFVNNICRFHFLP